MAFTPFGAESELVLKRSALLEDRADAFGDYPLVLFVADVGLPIGPALEVRDDREVEIPVGESCVVAKHIAVDLRNGGGELCEFIADGLLVCIRRFRSPTQ